MVGTSDQQIEWLAAHTSWAEKWAEKGFFLREQPQHELHVDTFTIGIHAVTAAQYRAFVDADGYQYERYWTESGLQWLEAEQVAGPACGDEALWMDDGRLPVVGVSWYEAAAFCNWMGEVLGRACRLPTEVEWEKAAGGGQERIYPWGNLFDPKKCNTRAANVKHTLACWFIQPGRGQRLRL